MKQPTIKAQAETVRCPFCHAEPNTYCVRPYLIQAAHPHKARIDAAAAARTATQPRKAPRTTFKRDK